jgi:hypothetical protein
MLPEDPRENCGYWRVTFNHLLKPYRTLCEWHDRVTSAGSFAERIGIPNWRVVQAWKDGADTLAKDITIKARWYQRATLAASKPFIAAVNWIFYSPAQVEIPTPETPLPSMPVAQETPARSDDPQECPPSSDQ